MEPFEGAGVFADPDELHPSQSSWGIGAGAEVVDVLQDAGPGCDTDACADEHCDLVVEDVFCGSAVRAIDADRGHFLSVLQGDFIHAHRI